LQIYKILTLIILNNIAEDAENQSGDGEGEFDDGEAK
jgi:hypothetical protein